MNSKHWYARLHAIRWMFWKPDFSRWMSSPGYVPVFFSFVKFYKFKNSENAKKNPKFLIFIGIVFIFFESSKIDNFYFCGCGLCRNLLMRIKKVTGASMKLFILSPTIFTRLPIGWNFFSMAKTAVLLVIGTFATLFLRMRNYILKYAMTASPP